MLKKLALAAALVATSALAQENTDISGANFQSGGADAALATLGRKAAAAGSRLVITAPKEWHAKIAAKIHAGGKADLVLRDGFYESVLVRVEDKSAAAAAPAAEPDRARAEALRNRAEVEKAKAETETAKAQAETAKAEAEKAKAEAEAAKATAEKASAEAAAAKARADAERAAAEKARAESERAAAASAKPLVALPAGKSAAKTAAAPAAAPAESDTRSRLQKALNDGRAAAGSLAVAKLQSGDTLYADGDQVAVIRREAGKPVMYWLEGTLDLRRSELKETAPNRYQVLAEIRGEGELRKEFAGENRVDAQIPAAGSSARAAFEKSLNNGQGFSDVLHTADLRSGDMLYVEGNTIAVARRDGLNLTRFWLVGSIDLQQAGILREAANRYKVTRDTIR
jgi:chemotaxis protein histidine kinase CheA